MITVRRVSEKGDRYCSACAAYRKDYYEDPDFYFYRVEIQYGSSSTVVTQYCHDCIEELIGEINIALFSKE